jgi:copper chaperone
METLKFKTNIKCSGCIATVTPHLNKLTEIESWEVDTNHPDKILTVSSEDLSSEQIISKLAEAGYNAETIKADS